jgi:hypothetical protein
MDLLGHTWMQRQLGQAVSCVFLTKDNGAIAGGWDGALRYWDAEGSQIWDITTSSRVSSILEYDDMFVATSGLEVVAVSKNDGKIMWVTALEGSSDGLLQFDNFIVATSSTYDIEHNDFIESAIWKISFDGDIEWVHRLDERPWYGYVDDQCAHFGLGRPRCGILSISMDNQETSHTPFTIDSPVMCGNTHGKEHMFGLASGHVVTEKTIIYEAQTGVEFLSTSHDGFLLGLENGDCRLFDQVGNEQWQLSGQAISGLLSTWSGPSSGYVWIARKRLDEGELVVVDEKNGDIIATSNTSRVHSMVSNDERLCIGFEDGQVIVWEREMFHRRQNQESQSKEIDPEKEAMRARLRALRR